jgi:hypothetical protein
MIDDQRYNLSRCSCGKDYYPAEDGSNTCCKEWDNTPQELMTGIMGVADTMMKNLHIIAKKDCACSHIARNTLAALGDKTYAKQSKS